MEVELYYSFFAQFTCKNFVKLDFLLWGAQKDPLSGFFCCPYISNCIVTATAKLTLVKPGRRVAPIMLDLKDEKKLVYRGAKRKARPFFVPQKDSINSTTHLFGLKLHLHSNAGVSLVIALQSIFPESTIILSMLLILSIAHTAVRNCYLYSFPSALFYILFHFIFKCNL